MRPVVTPSEMAAIDAEADVALSVLIERAAWATAQAAKQLLGFKLYGRRIAVLAGKGNNGADGRGAARLLEAGGATCTIIEVGGSSSAPTFDFDLIVDACFGTGLRGDFDAADLPVSPGDTPVLAVDIPSGVDGLTGELRVQPLCATVTVTFGAAKPGLLVDPGRRFVGELVVADIGLDCSRAVIDHVEPADVLARWPRRSPTDHKWDRAVYVIGGSAGMVGAPALTATAALRAGAGYVIMATPDAPTGLATSGSAGPIEAVGRSLPQRWAGDALEGMVRCGAAVIGPGLAPGQQRELEAYWEHTDTPTVFDAGALELFVPGIARRPAGVLHVLTPHEGEFVRLTGQALGPDRVADVRELAADLGAVVLLKGPTTIVAHPDGRVLLSTGGDDRLATAGSGDVLAGIIGAAMAGGLDGFLAAGLGAELHGLAARRGHRIGLTASDIPPLVAELLSDHDQH